LYFFYQCIGEIGLGVDDDTSSFSQHPRKAVYAVSGAERVKVGILVPADDHRVGFGDELFEQKKRLFVTAANLQPDTPFINLNRHCNEVIAMMIGTTMGLRFMEK